MARRRVTITTQPGEDPRPSEVSNSARPMRITITEDDIRNGVKLEPSACAAAQAILRATHATECRVHRGVTKIKLGKKWVRFRTSSGLRLETIIFDRGGRFIPGEYDLLPVPISMIARLKKPATPNGNKPKRGRSMAAKRYVIPGVRRAANQKEKPDD